MSGDDEALDFALAMHALLRRYQFQDVEQVCEYGITLTECHALELLALTGPLSVNDLARELRVNKSTASRAVQSLSDKNLVEREVDDEDARAWRLAPTPAGRKLFSRILAGSMRCYAAMLDEFSPAERRAARKVLRRLSADAACSPQKL
jgi:MarR family 2-MHQ and catechol resistance regulon transcriptional repressor